MRAIITKEFRCAPRGHTVETFAAGTEVAGQVAEWAVAAGHAERKDVAPERAAMASAPESKATRRTIRRGPKNA
jgi:hypothetical protein